MAKQIIILRVAPITPDQINVQFAMWFPVTAGVKFPQGSGSVWTEASAAESAAIQAGDVVEITESLSLPAGLAPPAVKAALQQHYQNRLAQFRQPGQFYGAFFDSLTGWSA